MGEKIENSVIYPTPITLRRESIVANFTLISFNIYAMYIYFFRKCYFPTLGGLLYILVYWESLISGVRSGLSIFKNYLRTIMSLNVGLSIQKYWISIFILFPSFHRLRSLEYFSMGLLIEWTRPVLSNVRVRDEYPWVHN